MKALITSITMVMLMVSVNAHASGQTKLMSIRAAEESAKRALLESLVGIRVASTAEVVDVVAKSFTIDSSVAGSIKGVVFDDPIYDPNTQIARVRARVDAGEVKLITGETIDYAGRPFTRIGFGTAVRESAGMLQAMRAAELDAFRQLVEYFYGLTIQGKTSVKDYVLQSDTLKSRFTALVYGANMDEEDPYGFDDGTAYVKLKLTVGDVEDVLGAKIEYTNTTLTVQGWGAERSEKVEDIRFGYKTQQVRHAEVQEKSLGIPVKNRASTVAAPMPVIPATGGGARID